MVKTFSSGDAVVWRFLSGTQPSQRPDALCHSVCLFFSLFTSFIKTSLWIKRFLAHILNQILPSGLFVHCRIKLSTWHIESVSLSLIHKRLHTKGAKYSSFIELFFFHYTNIFPLLISFPVTVQIWQTPKLVRSCRHIEFRVERFAPRPAAVSGDGYWLGPKPHIQSRHMRVPLSLVSPQDKLESATDFPNLPLWFCVHCYIAASFSFKQHLI